MKMNTKTLAALGAVLALTAMHASADHFGTAFNYQGQLASGGQGANGLYDLQFKLYDSLAGSTGQVGGTLTSNAVPVANGLFTVALDFGDGIFTGPPRWLDVSVRTNGGGAFTPLSPRQPLTPSPYSIFAASAASAGTSVLATVVAPGGVSTASLQDGAVTSAKIGGGNVVKTLNLLKDDVTLAAGANVTLTPAGQTLTLASPTDWHIGGNAGTTPGVSFLGTSDNQPLELWANGIRALRLEPNASGPNVIAGAPSNLVQSNTYAATIGGGAFNQIQSNALYATIGGGSGNQVQGLGISYAARYGFIGGGQNNIIEPFGFNATIGGGAGNRIQYDGDATTIGGGESNVIGTNADYSVIGGGRSNVVSKAASFATIPGGLQNVAGASYAFAAGRQAKANHAGSFVWADSTSADFPSTSANQFLIRAGGNVGINKNNPATALDVSGVVTATGFNGPGGSLTGIGTLSLADNSVTAAKLANDSASLAKVTAGAMTLSGSYVSMNAGIFLDDHDVLLRGDGYHGLGWYGTGKLFAGVNLNGPALYGCDGGGLGTACGGQKLALQWNAAGDVFVDPAAANTGALLPGLTFGPASGEGISSKRTSGGNQFGLDLYTDGQPRLSIDNQGRVGIGTTTPSDSSLDVHGDIRLNDTQLLLRPGTDRTNGLAWRGAFGSTNVNGPVLFGGLGGALGTKSSGGEKVALSWDANNTVSLPGVFRSGSETGTSQGPQPRGLVVRRINSTSSTNGQIVARTDDFTLERDGTAAGFVIKYPLYDYITVACIGIDSTGSAKNFYRAFYGGATSGTLQVYNNSDNVVHFECTFGVTYSGNSHLTTVTLTRYGTDFFWSGTLVSTYNQ